MNNNEPIEILGSIGIPVKNRAFCIYDVLQAIENQDYPKKMLKIVFVDDYSTDDTFKILKEWAERMKPFYYDVVLIQENSNIPKARNVCLDNMVGSFLLFWDSDVIPSNNLLKQFIRILDSDKKIGIIGADYHYETTNRLTLLFGKPVTRKNTHAVYLGFAIIKKEVFDAVGAFNEILDIGEDTDFGMRVVEKTDYKIMWSPESVLHIKAGTGSFKFGKRFVDWLSYNFKIRGAQYAHSFGELPIILRLRIFYYALFPLVMFSIPILMQYFSLPWALLYFGVYLLPGLFLAMRNSTVRRGLFSFFIDNIPTGIALSYGVIVATLKNLWGR